MSYGDLKLAAGKVHFREDGGVPRDAKVIGSTWQYVNKDGGPDRRFQNNHQIPIVLYGTVDVSAASGMRFNLQTSADELAASSVEQLRFIQEGVRQLESRQTSAPQSESLPTFADDPPPLFLLGVKTLRFIVGVLSFRWLEELPDWSNPVIWGLLCSLPPVAIIVRLARPGTVADMFLCSAFTVAGAGIGILLHASICRRRRDRVEDEAATKSRFRALLAHELKARELGDVNFSAIVAASDITLPVANHVAEEMFRKVADQFAKDGVVTSREQSKLTALAKVFDMDSTRAEQIESEAKAARYHQAVSEALADWTVTEEEAHLLNRLRWQLGVKDANWVAGKVTPRS